MKINKKFKTRRQLKAELEWYKRGFRALDEAVYKELQRNHDINVELENQKKETKRIRRRWLKAISEKNELEGKIKALISRYEEDKTPND